MLPLPSGWYALAARSEVPPGAVLTRRLGATERVLFRDAAGGLAVVDPYCPHLGAHLGRGGVVDGEVIVCPFHGLRFDRSGACVATPTGHRPPRTGPRDPPGRRERRVDLQLARSAGRAADLDPAGARGGRLGDAAHPRGRAADPPAGDDREQRRPRPLPDRPGLPRRAAARFEADGPHLQTRYSFVRPGGLPPLAREQEVHIHVHVWGLGFSYVDVSVPAVGVATRQFVLPTPVSAERIELRLGMALRRTPEAAWPVRWMPGWLFDRAIGPVAMRSYVEDVMSDREVWENKVTWRGRR